MNHPNGNPIADPIWSVPGFAQFWDACESLLMSSYGPPDCGWQLEIMTDCYVNQRSIVEAVAEIHEGYDPTP